MAFLPTPAGSRTSTGAGGTRRPARPARTLAAALTALALLAGCSIGGGDEDGPSGDGGATSTSTPLPDGAPEGLERFYGQQLEWSECQTAFECATLEVPIDYAEPDGATIEIALLRVPARGDSQGSLVVNPGGPGASGVDFASMAGAVFSGEVRSALDVVGFDPRGVGRSAPIDCVSDDELTEFLGADPTPDDEAEEQQLEQTLRHFAESCVENAPDLAAHISTIEVARDMDVLRAALGEETLTYLGASYGTYLGTVYANLFPDRVGRFVLDGAMDPTLDGIEVGKGQAAGFERATRAYVEDCVASGGCPLGDDVESALAAIPAFLEAVDADPPTVGGDTVGRLTEGWAFYGIVVAMYDQGTWPILTQALERAMAGDGTLMMFLANSYTSRDADGSYTSNMMEAFPAVSCLEAEDDDLDQEELEREFLEVSPTWGRHFAAPSACEYWPVSAAETLEEWSAPGAAPIVVIGTTRDPATPYEWAERLAEVLEPGVLISYDGDGHTAYGRSNDCVDDAVDAYLLEGTVPEDGLRC